MTGGDDYRKMGKSLFGETYFLETKSEASNDFENSLRRLTGKESSELVESRLTVFGRDIVLPKTCPKARVAYCTFDDLCNKPLGSNDYVTIADNFKVVFIKGLESLVLQCRRAEARRFISMIDNFYDNRVGVVFLSSCTPEDIFVVDNEDQHSWNEEQRLFMEQFYGGERGQDFDTMKGAGKNEKFAITSGEDERFALARLLSRLQEMRSEGYWEDVLRGMDVEV